MANSHEFDLWADSYDSSVKSADEEDRYPFAGYGRIINAVYETVMARAPAKILDIGFGTAVLTSRLYDVGNNITGIDFSTEMLDMAKGKMPEADLLRWDFTQGIPTALANEKFDFIISTYALHHLEDDEKIKMIADLLDLLNPTGAILIGDICFLTREDLLACKTACGDLWDDSESYFVPAEIKDALKEICRLSYRPISFCSGLIEIKKGI